MSAAAGPDPEEDSSEEGTSASIDARHGSGTQIGSGNIQNIYYGAADPRLAGAGAPEPPTRAASFSAVIRDRYGQDLAEAGLPVPDSWDETTLGNLRRAHLANAKHGRDAAADLLEALCLAVGAVPVLGQIGGSDISITKLRHLYRRHVGRLPDWVSREEMLVLAASATVAERRRVATDPGHSPEPLIALARFLLGIAGHSKAATNDPVALDDASLGSLADFLTGPLMQQREDAARYLAEEVGRRFWALVELIAEDGAERTRPTRIVLDLISERGEVHTRPVACDPALGASTPEECVRRALRDVVSMLPDGEVLIDLCLPRQWLDLGMEHWEVVEVGGRQESMSRHYSPRLRWAMHRHDKNLRARLEKRCRAVDWSAEPEAIPTAVTGDPAALAGWLDSRNHDEARHPPYFAAIAPSGAGHDPLRELLWEGYGFAVWLPAPAAEPACAEAARVAADIRALERRDDLPQTLAAGLRALKPVIIWSDPEGREGFPLPASRGGGTKRGGAE